ncbi:MAG: hypothetical protein WC479_10215 [Candidatus Izemoplasmatales bacterium]
MEFKELPLKNMGNIGYKEIPQDIDLPEDWWRVDYSVTCFNTTTGNYKTERKSLAIREPDMVYVLDIVNSWNRDSQDVFENHGDFIWKYWL